MWVELTSACVVDVYGPGGDEIDGRRGGVRAVHVANQLSQTKLPLGVGILLQAKSRSPLESVCRKLFPIT
jgi:hypothetical protein